MSSCYTSVCGQDTRICNICHIKKSIEEFGFHDKKAGKRRQRCKICHNAHHRNTNTKYREIHEEEIKNKRLFMDFGITIKDYFIMLQMQDGGCAICGTKVPGRGHAYFAIDHKHVEGYRQMPPEEKRKYIRGLVCFTHNVGLGCFDDDPDMMEKGRQYLIDFENRTKIFKDIIKYA